MKEISELSSLGGVDVNKVMDLEEIPYLLEGYTDWLGDTFEIDLSTLRIDNPHHTTGNTVQDYIDSQGE
ncbi:hypothetical protein RND61_14845 [Streptomyces sp. TRM76323]|uniref:Uncharacterized protein n=1 Tax=Streptomyces tamarix TaxID=3078565 RepID=A0ABU3QKQ6_9ACTN|nr:hypothetical protein [Streptomyces tamarix]MDT9683341.1 hypothetical protein [Streptomyces tamarix]